MGGETVGGQGGNGQRGGRQGGFQGFGRSAEPPFRIVAFARPRFQQVGGLLQRLSDSIRLRDLQRRYDHAIAAAKRRSRGDQRIDRSGHAERNPPRGDAADGEQHGEHRGLERDEGPYLAGEHPVGHKDADRPAGQAGAGVGPGCHIAFVKRLMNNALVGLAAEGGAGLIDRAPDITVGIPCPGDHHVGGIDHVRDPFGRQPLLLQQSGEAVREHGNGQVVNHRVALPHRHIEADHGPPGQHPGIQVADRGLAGIEDGADSQADFAGRQIATPGSDRVEQLLTVPVSHDDVGVRIG